MQLIVSSTILAVIGFLTTNVNCNIFARFGDQLQKMKLEAANQYWPPVVLPNDLELHGVLYTYNNKTKVLAPYRDTTIGVYIDSKGNREKIITQANFSDIGFAEVIDYKNANEHKQYKQTPKISKCEVNTLASDYNITQRVLNVHDNKGKTTKYLGVYGVAWDQNKQYHQFRINLDGEQHQLFFNTDTFLLTWYNKKGTNLYLNIPGGAFFRVYTDADFDGLNCNPTQVSIPRENYIQ
ncbi:UNKNOWN [Stylonychia lemnae]|uniref:Uncharacterized protein n=1 Tax=Stylonychia lemnae TaxID=5949 RepID=A0A078BAB2_STYLE|nr:UNKNOWN [Stylonychia lemnae]|eukprot:CDW90453.1 UNKNOWN [Stylonychia lemnae]